ncbi:uncharacterized protein N7506_010347 [Penicillium brevicompactum]|uniref:uncharacterized protein n=1 Tax=Penicillium brevicompactum TaxID=5074 RepID=UPI0025415CF2|nr:uncharacterized protein N7506_010347 [Penicillium brevicompactum]KAJ5327245.1 hypothetical protein N7506_010347 [Penicillium brevicompactum]
MTLSNAVTTWEMAYHDAWHQWIESHAELASMVSQRGWTFTQREVVIGKLGLLQLQLRKVIERVLTMIREAPKCRTLRKDISGVNADDLIRILEGTKEKVTAITEALMKRESFEVELKICGDIIRLAVYLDKHKVQPYLCHAMRLVF